MTRQEFKEKLKKVEKLAKKYNWRYDSQDLSTYRASFKDELSIYRIDIYLSKMTVGLLPVGDKPIFYKRQNLEMIEMILKHPHEFE